MTACMCWPTGCLQNPVRKRYTYRPSRRQSIYPATQNAWPPEWHGPLQPANAQDQRTDVTLALAKDVDARSFALAQKHAFDVTWRDSGAGTFRSHTLAGMMIRSDRLCYALHTLDQATIGGAMVCPRGETALLQRIFVVPGCQRQGYGRFMLACFESVFPVQEWQANIAPHMRACVAFFVQMGYVEVRRDRQFCYMVKRM